MFTSYAQYERERSFKQVGEGGSDRTSKQKSEIGTAWETEWEGREESGRERETDTQVHYTGPTSQNTET